MNRCDLVLFDIDGTLVRRAGPHHRLALEEAVHRVTGLHTTTEGVPLHGMLDPDILTIMMRREGLDEDTVAAVMPEVFEVASDLYIETAPGIADKRCPGVIELLDQLREHDTPLVLVTGNLTRIGWRKLENAGLHQYFRFGAFGEMAATRGGLARLAIERAVQEKLILNRAKIALVGDAPQDVQAAKENHIVSIAVRTGVTPPGELEALNPDYLLDDLTCWPVFREPNTVVAADSI